jgi:hypothetical protein
VGRKYCFVPSVIKRARPKKSSRWTIDAYSVAMLEYCSAKAAAADSDVELVRS